MNVEDVTHQVRQMDTHHVDGDQPRGGRKDDPGCFWNVPSGKKTCRNTEVFTEHCGKLPA